MPKKIQSRLDSIEEKLENRTPLNKFDVFWMARRLRQYENQLILAAKTIEEYVPGVGELDPIEVGCAVNTYMKAFDSIIKMEQIRVTLNRRNHD